MIVRIWGIGRLGAVGSLGEEEGCFGGRGCWWEKGRRGERKSRMEREGERGGGAVDEEGGMGHEGMRRWVLEGRVEEGGVLESD